MESIYLILVCVSAFLHLFQSSQNAVNGQEQDNFTVNLSSPSDVSMILESEQNYIRPIVQKIKISPMPKWVEDNIVEGVLKWYNYTCFKFSFVKDPVEKITYAFEHHPRRKCLRDGGSPHMLYPIALSPGCDSAEYVTHRLGHLYSMYDEQMRLDRDDHLEILNNEDFPSFWADDVLGKYDETQQRGHKRLTDTWSTYANNYDVFSVMNLPPRAFDQDSKTLYRMKNYKLRGLLGRFNRPSTRDLYRMNMRLGCIGFSRRRCGVSGADPCLNGGFTAGHCKCVCTEDRTGPICETLIENTYVTGDQLCNYRITTNESVLWGYIYENSTMAESWCSIEIEAPEGHYIIIKLETVEPYWTLGYENCTEAYMSIIEIKKEADKEIVLCGKDLSDFTFYKSETNKVDILYDSRKPGSFRGFNGTVTFHKYPATTTPELTTTTTTITTQKPTTTTTITIQKPTTTNTMQKPKTTTTIQKPKTTTTTQKPKTRTTAQKLTTTTQKPTTTTQKSPITTQKPPITTHKPNPASDITTIATGGDGTTNHGSDKAFEPIWLLGYLTILFIADYLLQE